MFHDETAEGEIITLDAGLRMEGQLALTLWELVFDDLELSEISAAVGRFFTRISSNTIEKGNSTPPVFRIH